MAQQPRSGLRWTPLLAFLASAIPPAAAQPPPTADTIPEVIVVSGRLPGPAPWKVSKGDHVLWIFGYPEMVPEQLEWDSARLERALEQSQEFLSVPRLDSGRAAPDVETTNPDGALLVDVVPPDVYESFRALMEEMMPDAVEGLAKYRPWVIGTGMLPSLSRTSGLTDSSDILRKIDGLVRDQPDLRRTSIEVEASRAERQLLREMYETSTPEITQEQEVACFAAAIANARNDIAVLQRRANAWAEGQLAELIGLQTSREQQDYCTFRIVGSVEREVATRLSGELWERWHAAVDAALSGNESTVALLPVNALIDERETGILQQLQRRGYTVERAP